MQPQNPDYRTAVEEDVFKSAHFISDLGIVLSDIGPGLCKTVLEVLPCIEYKLPNGIQKINASNKRYIVFSLSSNSEKLYFSTSTINSISTAWNSRKSQLWPAAETPVFLPIFHLLTNAGCCENSNTEAAREGSSKLGSAK